MRSGRSLALSALVVCGLLTQMSVNVQEAHALDRRVVIYNHTSSTMRRFHASNIGRTIWEENILGRRVLRPGDWVTIDIDDGSGYCRYDLQAVFSNGSTAVRRDINVCEVESWTITD